MSIELPLSVIIPVYNGAKTIVRCLDSLVAIPNAATALEIIVINDGSQDETLEVVTDYQAQSRPSASSPRSIKGSPPLAIEAWRWLREPTCGLSMPTTG